MKLTKIRNYFLTYLVFALGGTPFFFSQKWVQIAVFIILIIIFIYKKIKINEFYFAFMLLIGVIFIFQKYFFGGGTFINFGLIFLQFTNPYLFFKIIGKEITKYYVDVTCFFAIVGLIFYFFSIVSPAFYNFTSTLPELLGTDPTKVPINGNPLLFKQNFIVYTYETSKVYGNILRSPGPFWEPGVYAAFLVVALIFNFSPKRSFFDKKNLILMIALVTTFSTAGYPALFLYFLFYAFTISNRLLKALALFFTILLSFQIFINTEFLYQKIDAQIEEVNFTQKSGDISRISSFKNSIITTLKYPFFGRGLIKDNMPTGLEGESASYGFLGMGARVGIIIFFIIITGWYKGLSRITGINDRKFNIISLLMLFSVLISEAIYFTPLFLIIFYNGYIRLNDKLKRTLTIGAFYPSKSINAQSLS